MSLHKANSTQIAASFAGISLTRDPDGYEGLTHIMRVGLWIRCSDRVERPVAWALVNDANVIETVTELCSRSWFAMLDILDGYQDIVSDTYSHAVDEYSLGRLTREMREECMDYNEYILVRSHIHDTEDAIKRISSETLARCYRALGAKYEWWRSKKDEHALVPRLAQAQDITPGSLRLPILTWDGKADEYAVSNIYDFIGSELEPIMSPYDEDLALEHLADLIATPDYRTAWNYSAREVPEWYGAYPQWVYQTDFELA